MARKHPRKHRIQREKVHGRKKFHLQFLFTGEHMAGLSAEYFTEFAGKIRPEYASHAEVCLISDPGPGDALPPGPVRLLDAAAGPGPDDIREGYVVLLDPRILEGQFNPSEFFQLDLPEQATTRKYWEIHFAGKRDRQAGGLIIPSDVMHYALAVSRDPQALDTRFLRLLLRKLGFGREEAEIHQDCPMQESEGKHTLIPERLRLNLAWNTLFPIRETREPGLRKLFFVSEYPLFRLAFLATALAIFLVLPILSLDAGLSGDDEKHYNHAIKVYRYFSEDDPSALDDPRYKLNYYGQSFDFFTYLVIRLFNLEEHPYEARHVMVALAGAAAILFTALLVKLFAGYAGGWLALVLMFLSPRFLGHAFNNPMDIPFALGNIFTLYHMILFLRKLPTISIRSAIWIAVGIGWTNGIRIGGLLLVPYLFMFSGLYLLIHKWPWSFFSAGWWKFALRGLLTLVLISLSGYLLSLLSWPYALQDIVNHPIQSFKVMSNIQVSIRVLYDGAIYWSDNLPWHYIPKNVLLTVPVLILSGWFLSALTWYLDRKEGNGYWYFLLWFTVLFPVVFIIYRESNVYGGWRHMMFIYPSMLALSALAISSLIRKTPRGWPRYAASAVVVAGMIHPARHIVRNHPNTYIYFNEWSGGIDRTFGKFETDYYANSLRPASDYFIEHILPELETPGEDPVRVVSNFPLDYYFREYRDRVQPFYSRYYDRGKYDWDYAILYCNYIHPYQLNHGMWPPSNTTHRIKVDDVVVAAIVERKNREDYLGSSMLAEGIKENSMEKVRAAIGHLEQAVAYDPHNEAAYLELGNAYMGFVRFEDARRTMDTLLSIYPDYDKALNLKGYSYLIEAEVKGDLSLIDDAIGIINLAIKSNYKFYSGYYNLGLCYGMKNDRDNAEYYLKQAIRFNGKFKAAYEKLAELYEFYGDTELAKILREQARLLPG